MRFLNSLYEATCNITEEASTKNTNPIIESRSSLWIKIAIPANAAPIDKEATSPINTLALGKLKYKKIKTAPAAAEQKVAAEK